MKNILINCAVIATAVFGSFGCSKTEIKPDVNVSIEKLTLSASPSSISQTLDNSLLAYYHFNDSRGKWFEESVFFPYSSSISDDVARSGKSLKVQLRKGDNIRAELGTDPLLAPKEGWYGFSLFFPLSYEKDKSSTESIVQFQARPDFHLGEDWRSAPLFLGVLNDRLILEIRTDANKVTKPGQSTFERIDLGPLIKGEWQDLVFHIKWAHDNTGVVELFRHWTLLYSRKNKPNCYNDVLNPYFKIGIYKWDWEGKSESTTTERTIYIDEVRIGDSKSSFDKVSPRSK